MTDEVKVEIEVTENATKTIPQVNRAFASMRQETRGVGLALGQVVPGMNILTSAMRLGVAGGAIYAGAKLLGLTGDLAQTSFQLAETGSQTLRLTDSFDNLWASAGGGGAALAELRAASMGTISDTNLMLAANRAMMLGVSADAEQLGDLLEVASFRGRALGMSTQQAFSDIVTGIGRMSPLILDNLGIVVDAEARFREYAASIGKTAAALTETERRQVLLNSVLREGSAQIEAAGGLADDSAANFERFATQVTNLKSELEKLLALKFAPFVGAIADDVGEFVTLFTADEEAMAQAATSYEDYVARFAEAFGWYEQMRRHLIATQGFSIFPEKRLGFSQDDFNRLKFESGMASLQATVEWGVGSPDKLLPPVRRTAAEIRRLLKFDASIDSDKMMSDLAGDAADITGMLADAVNSGVIKEAYARELLTGAQNGISALFSYLQETPGGVGLFDYLLYRGDVKTAVQDLLDFETDAKESARRTAESMADSMRSAIQQVMGLTFEGDPGNVLDRMGLHIDTVDEDARRMASVMAEGLHSEWTAYFKDKGLFSEADLASDKSIIAKAAQYLNEAQMGSTALLNIDTAVAQATQLQAFRAEQEAFIREVASRAGVSLDVAGAAIGDFKSKGSLDAAEYKTGWTMAQSQWNPVALGPSVFVTAASDLAKNGQPLVDAYENLAERANEAMKKKLLAGQSVIAQDLALQVMQVIIEGQESQPQ